MPDDYRIRDYEPADYPGIAALWTETGMGDPRRGDSADVVARTLEKGGRLFVLEDAADGRIVGTSWVTDDGRRLLLHHFAVRPSHQGRGLAKLLVRASLRTAKERGMQIKLEVHRDNAKAIALYRGAGFVRLGDYDVYIVRDVEALDPEGSRASGGHPAAGKEA
jgi:ribosomal protein S18 acetylase RimI-like enzyme